jgi:hypothetical protein
MHLRRSSSGRPACDSRWGREQGAPFAPDQRLECTWPTRAARQTIDERGQGRSRRVLQRIQGARRTAIHGHEDWPKSQMALRPGEWKETKSTPDLWHIGYAVTKRRAGRAPEGSGVPVGTEYHWYILAHQNIAKQAANDYTTPLTGLSSKSRTSVRATGSGARLPDPAQAHDHVLAKRARRPGETCRL